MLADFATCTPLKCVYCEYANELAAHLPKAVPQHLNRVTMKPDNNGETCGDDA